MNKKIKKFLHLFFKGAYAVGYRRIPDTDHHFDNNYYFQVIEPTLHRWYADPFPFVDGKREFIFAEIVDDCNGEKGTIGVIDLEKDPCFIEIINEPFHMSFPNVFKYKNEIYMLPETSEANQLRLYKAIEFPYKWEFNAILLDSIKIVDTIILTRSDGIYAIGQIIPEKKNVLFRLDIENGQAVQLELTGNYIDKRPAGNFIQFPDGVYHTLQECGRVYGEYLRVCKVSSFENGQLDETEIRTYKIEDMSLNSTKKYKRVHTFNRMGNLEVVDLMYYQINPTVIIEKIKRSYKHKKR